MLYGLSIHLLKDILGALKFYQLWIKLMKIFCAVFVCVCVDIRFELIWVNTKE